MMKIIIGYPPNYNEIAKVLTVRPRTIFTYGEAIYNPLGARITGDLIAHEEVHMRQQGALPHVWWKRYLSEPLFRLDQEREAYGRQFQYICAQNPNRNFQFQVLRALALLLAGPMYGNLTDIETAMELIRYESKSVGHTDTK